MIRRIQGTPEQEKEYTKAFVVRFKAVLAVVVVGIVWYNLANASNKNCRTVVSEDLTGVVCARD